VPEGLTLDGYSLAALAIVAVAVLILIALLRRDKAVGISRYGFFIERERFDEVEIDQDTKVLWPKEDG
jgi:hypothetical protein